MSDRPYPETAPDARAIYRLCSEAGHKATFWFLCTRKGLSKTLADWTPDDCRYMWYLLECGAALGRPYVPTRGWLSGPKR